MIVCVCNKASRDCDKVCAKGRLLRPKQIFVGPWPRVVSRDMENAIRTLDLNDLEK